jgi:hypothetical protein
LLYAAAGEELFILLILSFVVNISFTQVPVDTAIDFTVKDIDGSNIEHFHLLDDEEIVVIDFFSTACSSCARYAPCFQASNEVFGESTGNIFFMSISWGDNNAGVAYFDLIYNPTLHSVSGSQGGGNAVHDDYQVISTPTVILQNSDNEIVEQYMGTYIGKQQCRCDRRR